MSPSTLSWVVLVVSGVLEAGWALSLKASDGFTKLWPSVLFVVLLVASMGGLAWALKTLPVGVVTELVQGGVYQWGPLMAGALLGSLPVAFVYSFFVEYYVSGLTGSVKE